MKLLTGNANRPLAEAVAHYLKLPLFDCTVERFADQEANVQLHENVRGEDVYILQPTSTPADAHLMELLVLTDALRRSSARRITAVIPYFGYARQDRRAKGRTPISAKLVANLIAAAGIHRVITVDLHTDQIQGFFDIPTDNLYVTKVLLSDIAEHYDRSNLMIVSPHEGGVARARRIAKPLGIELAIVDKRSTSRGAEEISSVIGDVAGKTCLLIDDIVDSGTTLLEATDALLQAGAKSVSAYITHAVLSGDACQRIANSRLSELVVTNSIQQSVLARQSGKIRQMDIAPLIGMVLDRTASEQSVSSLFV